MTVHHCQTIPLFRETALPGKGEWPFKLNFYYITKTDFSILLYLLHKMILLVKTWTEVSQINKLASIILTAHCLLFNTHKVFKIMLKQISSHRFTTDIFCLKLILLVKEISVIFSLLQCKTGCAVLTPRLTSTIYYTTIDLKTKYL